MRKSRAPSGGRRGQAGFTVIELVIALTLGTIVLGAAVAYLIREIRTLAGNELRESLARNGRYIGVSLRHDVQRAGVGIESTTDFGTVAVRTGAQADTLILLNVPYVPDLAAPHALVPPTGATNPLPPGGTCGARCVDVFREQGEPFDLQAGDLARLQVLTTRRLIQVESVELSSDSTARVTFSDAASLLGWPAGLSGGVRLDLYGTFVQKLEPIIYYLDDRQRLNRAVALRVDGTPEGFTLAYDVAAFDVRLVFADGDEGERADGGDGDDSNDFDDVVAVRLRVTAEADRADPRVNQGRLLQRTWEWTIAPRNLRYEKKRL